MNKLIPLIVLSCLLPLAANARTITATGDTLDHAESKIRQQAAREGASYIAFGRFFTSQTKPGAPSATPELLEQARARFALPITAIGGVGLDNGAELISRGADLLAVVHALFSAPSATEVEARARAFGALFTAS